MELNDDSKITSGDSKISLRLNPAGAPKKFRNNWRSEEKKMAGF